MHGCSPLSVGENPLKIGNKKGWQETSCVEVLILRDWVWQLFSLQNLTFLKPASAGFLFFRSSQFFPSNWSRVKIGRRNRCPRVRLCPESCQGINIDRLRSK